MTDALIRKLALGTVQFGLDYGISNTAGQTALNDVKAILDYAASEGVTLLDTASQYGNSESVLGDCLGDKHAFEIVTKTPAFRTNQTADEVTTLLNQTFEASLVNLKTTSLKALLVHQADDLLSESGAALFQAMQTLKAAGRVAQIGVSVYTQAQIEAITDRFEIDIVQAPVNLLDQRLVQSGALQQLKDKGIEVHVRSAFLQGLLLMPAGQRPDYFKPIEATLNQLHVSAKEAGVSPLTAALQFALQLEPIDRVVVGVNNRSQLTQIVSAASKADVCLPWADFAVQDEQFSEPGEVACQTAANG